MARWSLEEGRSIKEKSLSRKRELIQTKANVISACILFGLYTTINSMPALLLIVNKSELWRKLKSV